MNIAERPAFGQSVSLGTLYDAIYGTFLTSSILAEEMPPQSVVTEFTPKLEVTVARDGTYEECFQALGISGDIAASIITEQITLQGSHLYPSSVSPQQADSISTLSAAFHIKYTYLQQKLILPNVDLQKCFDGSSLQCQECTHIVVGATSGLYAVIMATCKTGITNDLSDTRGAFNADIELLRLIIRLAVSASAIPHAESSEHIPQAQLKYEYAIYSDLLEDEARVVCDTREVFELVKDMVTRTRQEKDHARRPLSYTLLPVSVLPHITPLSVPMTRNYNPVSTDHMTKIASLLDDFGRCQRRLEVYSAFLDQHNHYADQKHVREITTALNCLDEAKTKLKAKLSQTLILVRTGTSSPAALAELHRDFNSSGLSPWNFSSIVDRDTAKLSFVAHAITRGAQFLSSVSHYNETAQKSMRIGCYIFLINSKALQAEEHWQDSVALVNILLNQVRDCSRPAVYIADCDALALPLQSDHARVAYYQNGVEEIFDCLEHQKYKSNLCLADFHENALRTNVMEKPIKRRFVKIACPGPRCDPTRICKWICSRCFAPIENGFSDDYIYCDCGRVPFPAYKFLCNNEQHGPDYVVHNKKKLKNLLHQVDQSDYVNILILGETGVGKSTFINAFVNYLSYPTLDDAKAAEGLMSVVPCSFPLQVMDHSGKGIEERMIRVGERKDEADGTKGASATQQTNVYSITIGTKTYRLIDTPGIGDTRGVAYDKKNMSDILQTLSSYESLHGILILLKSNNSRLTIMFRFCVKELLAHLHRSAAQNIVFGFTNTRISNYTPGDTFSPLKTLLQEHPEVGLTLSKSTTYCFDSESFRFLAAHKDGACQRNEEDFRRSWVHSKKEAHRLIDYFQARRPHDVRATMSLNGARRLIMELIKPMAEISKLIRDNIAAMEDKERELQDTKLSGDNLQKRLTLQKIQYKSVQLTRPRTVCKSTDCCEYKDSGKNDNTVTTIYKTHCHVECHLKDVEQDVVAHPNLIQCTAFGGGDHCIICGHHWQEHMHVLYELKEVRVRVTDRAIERQLQANGNDVVLRQMAIATAKQHVDEFRKEHHDIQEAAARFCLFLRKYAMTPINDATLEYLNMLIQDEKAKIEVGKDLGYDVSGNKKRLRALEEDVTVHNELLDTLQSNAEASECLEDEGLDETGVESLVTRLYNLKHFGKTLHDVKKTITEAHRGTYRERSFRVAQSDGRKGKRSRFTVPDWMSGVLNWTAVAETSTLWSFKTPR